MLSFVEFVLLLSGFCFFFFKQKTAYEMRISDWSSDVCSSDLFHSSRWSTTCATSSAPSLLAGSTAAPASRPTTDRPSATSPAAIVPPAAPRPTTHTSTTGWMITRQGVCAAVEQPAGLDLRRRGPRRGRDRTGIPPTPSGEDGRTTGHRPCLVVAGDQIGRAHV